MDVMNKLISTNKRLYREEKDLKEEVVQMSSLLLAEESHLASTKFEQQSLAQNNDLLQQNLDSADTTFELMKSFQDVAKSSIMLHSFLKVFMENADPDDQQQSEVYNKLKSNYAKMVEKYESCPTYKAILKEQLQEQEMSNKIATMRAKIEELSKALE